MREIWNFNKWNCDKVVYDNSDASLNDIIPIKDSISEFFPTGQVIWGRENMLNSFWRQSNDLEKASFKTESFYESAIDSHNPNFWTTGQMTSNHGTCTNNKNECKQVTVNSEICFSRDDATPQTPHADIQVSLLSIFNKLLGCLKLPISFGCLSKADGLTVI